ncbi:hypothetical protein [Rathayibacter sp. Leaf248]|uniref:hypothetical protein n=1 Tax=Rathayibacter sp. Leaf248 TaxID=2876555 RepID=UPI001E386516|nr:hypothetical protein [Rathayibacter sp. Leaf248]
MTAAAPGRPALDSGLPQVRLYGRRSSVKRVASAVGEGAMAVTFAHRHLQETS